MKKFVLVVFVGMVLALDLFGIVNEITEDAKEVDHIEETTTIVYVE